MFVTLLYGTYSPSSGKFVYANGGHNPPLVVHPDGSSTILPPTGGIALGVAENIEYTENSVTLQQGDKLVLYSDGVTEALNESGEEYGLDRLREVVAAANSRGADEITGAVFDSVKEFAGIRRRRMTSPA